MVGTSDYLDGSKWEDEDIVISGISARLPSCDSVEEFQQKLLSKIDLITDEPRRFQNDLYGAIKRYGLLKDLSKFDAKFFNIHPKQAQRMDPQIRGLLEVTYEAIVDAGLHPEDLKGSRTGIVVGVASSETQDKWSQMPDKINGFEYTGCTRTMFANRVSYMFDLKGPSYSIDTASSTTLVAFQQAYDMIKDGVCEACFVCGTDLVLNPCVCLMFQCLNMLSPEGKCKAFDISGDGYVRSEGVVAVLLQKAKTAKRVYAKVLAAGSNCDGYKDEGITFPSGPQQVKLFRKVANLAGIDPSQIDFMEAHGSATRVGDPQEMNAVTEVFTKNRTKPLRTGSIKSNMGHAEPASALSAVIKVCVAMECGILPPNLHYKVPNPDIPALLDGRLKVITEPTPWDGGLVAVNSFGVGGANGHALLLSNKKIKQNIIDTIPRLVCLSGVTKSAVENMFHKIFSLSRDPELYALLNNVFRKNIKGHDFRGFLILSGNGDKEIKQIDRYSEQKLCLVFPGVEGNWKSTASDIFDLTEFQNSVNNCQNALKNVANINLKQILETLSTEKSVLNVVLGITALQIGIIDVLASLQLVPNSVIGFNIGEIAAGYATGSYNSRQAILSAFHIGSILQRFYQPSTIIKANVPWNKYVPPSDISILAQISSRCTYFSGPKQSIDSFNQMLSSRGNIVEEIGTNAIDINGILKSSKNIPKLSNDLQQVLSETKKPSENWLTYAAQKSSNVASHLITSLTSASPILKAIQQGHFSFGLKVGFENNEEIFKKNNLTEMSVFHGQADAYSFICSVGKLYNFGFQPQIQNLYPKIQFPVSHKTPMIQSMIEWDHSTNWNVVTFAPKNGRTAGEIEVVVDFDKEEFKLLPENYLNNNQVLPKSFYIVLLWRAISRLQVKSITEIPLIIENINFVRETAVPDDGNVTFFVNIMNTSNKFEIFENGSVVVRGHVYLPTDLSKEFLPKKIFDQNSASCTNNEIHKNDIYNDLGVKHYHFNESFQQLKSVNLQSNTSKVTAFSWNTLLESFLQVAILSSEFAENTYPEVSFIRKIVINPEAFKTNEEFVIKYNKAYNAFNSDCVEIKGIKIKRRACLPTIQPQLEAYKFVPFISMKVPNACDISLQIALENWSGQSEIKIAELSSYNTFDSFLSPKLVSGNPSVTTDITVYTNEPMYHEDQVENFDIKIVCKDLITEPVDTNCHIVVASNVLSNFDLFDNIIKAVRSGGCIVLKENIQENINRIEDTELQLVSYLTFQDKAYIVLKKMNLVADKVPYVITVSNDSLDWVKKFQQIPDQLADNVLVVAKGVETYDILNFVRSVKTEMKNKNLSVVIIEDETAPMFSITCELYHHQLRSNYPVNVFKNGTWGTYVSLPLSEDFTVACNDVYVGFDCNKNFPSITFIKDRPNNFSTSHKNNKNPPCEVYSASLNLQDQSLVKGKFADVVESKLGLEFAGFSGKDKVFGLVPEGGITSTVIANQDYVWNVPKNWSLDEAATVPFSYALAYYSLCVRSQAKKGDSILIVGANSTAIAALNIALQYQLNLFILLTDKSQKLVLKKLFPQLEDSQVITSKNDNFYLQILHKTANKGVNIVFDTWSCRKYNIRAYINSLSGNGKLLYLDNEDISEKTLGSSGNMKCLTAHRITASCLFDDSTAIKQVGELITNGLKCGAIQPLPFVAFSDAELSSAFNYEREKDDLYKAIINIRSETNSSNVAKTFHAKPKVYFNNSKSFIILGGTSGFGLYVTNWMISQGVNNVVLLSSENESSSENLKEIYLHKWKSLNVSVIILKLSNPNVKTCENIVKKAQQLGAVEGIFDFTAFEVSENRSLDSLNESDFKNINNSKCNFIRNMDSVSRKLCKDLKYFVSFSAVDFLYGEKGYGLNSYSHGVIQNIMRQRSDAGLSAALIQWGNIGELEKQVLYRNTNSSNLAFQPINSCLRVLHAFLDNSEVVLSSYIVNKRTGNETHSKADAILEGVAKFLGIKNPSSILPTLTMLELGLDSLIGTDIQQFLEINYGVALSTQEVRELTFEKLRNLANTL